ncbi:MAG: sel1 repeat family protein [Gammaproteobacteria bacterium]|nr:sel1 repeat family protein [Gammaproteobacteria bacterium]
MKKTIQLFLILLSGVYPCTPYAALQESIHAYEYQATGLDAEYTSRILALDGLRQVLQQELNNGAVAEITDPEKIFMPQDLVDLAASVMHLTIVDEAWSAGVYRIQARVPTTKSDLRNALTALRGNTQLEQALRESNAALASSRQLIQYLQNRLAQKLSADAVAVAGKSYTSAVKDMEVEFAFQAVIGGMINGKLKNTLARFKKLAHQGHATAQFRLGYMYQHTIGVEQDSDRAYSWYLLALQNGYVQALSRIGYLYERGLGLSIDYRKAAEYYQQASMLGDALGMVRLGYLYLTGFGVTKNLAMAVDLIKKSAQLQNELGLSKLGYLYETGIGVVRDHKQAAALFQQAAQQGNANAMARLGLAYLYGRGVEQDMVRAYPLFAAAAERADPVGMAQLGFMYEKAYTVNQDYDQALRLYKAAGEQGAVFAWYRLGVMYELGSGVQQDRQQAITWFRKAAESGHQQAQQKLDRLQREES